LEFAQATFLASERVEMGALATQLDVSQATIYRWFGSRERLIEQVIDRIAREFLAATKAEVQGEGNERVLDFVRRFMEITVSLAPVRAFVERETQLALRLLLGEDGVIRGTLREAMAEIVAETRSPAQARALEEEIDILVEVGIALEWATFAIGDKPQIDHAVHIMRVLLEAHGKPHPRQH
jgi:AcrR family transcriptional regulator